MLGLSKSRFKGSVREWFGELRKGALEPREAARQADALNVSLDKLVKWLDTAMASAGAGPFKQPVPSNNRPAERPATRTFNERPGLPHAGSTLPIGEQRVLTAIAQYASAERDTISILTGYKRSSRDAYIQRLREKGFVEQRGDALHATSAGMTALGPCFEPLPSGTALQRYWMERLPAGEAAMLRILIERYPGDVDMELLSEKTSYQRSSRYAYLQCLAARRLVVRNRGTARAADGLFD